MNCCTSGTEPAAADAAVDDVVDVDVDEGSPLLLPSGRSVSQSVRNWPISLEQAGSYSEAGIASRT